MLTAMIRRLLCRLGFRRYCAPIMEAVITTGGTTVVLNRSTLEAEEPHGID